jgi:hypothetical protein
VAGSTASSAATASASLPPEQQAALHAAKLRALVGAPDLELTPLPGGAAARSGTTGWFLAADHRGLGPALAWADGVEDLRVLADAGAGVLARRAALFDPEPTVWAVDGRELIAAEPEPADEPPAVAPLAEEFALLLADAGADVVREHGVVTGEVLGLEIARVVVDDEGGASLEVGVGRHDREAFQMVHGDVPTRDALASVIATVRENRRAGAEAHPLYRLAPERWVRSVLARRPELVGASHLTPVDPVLPRESVKDVVAACLVGDGVVVACSVGVDLDLVPTAAEIRALHAPGARLVLAVPGRDDHPVTRRIAARLRQPAEIAVLPEDWRA